MNVRCLIHFAFAIALLTGCAPSYTNLTPRDAARTSSDVYHFEVQWDTSRRGANNATVAAYVAIGENLYPMQRVPGTRDRWEGSAPIPAGSALVPYRYKFDYSYPTIASRVPDSDFSPQYYLDLSKGVSVISPAPQ